MLQKYSALTPWSRMRTKLAGPLRRVYRLIVLAIVVSVSGIAFAASPAQREKNNYYLPSQRQSRIVSVSTTGEAEAEVIVLTEEVVTKEHGSPEVITKFGEVYAFAPSFIAVRKDQPTRITFWNLQADDEHDFMLADPGLNVMMHVKLAPLSKNSWLFTFHQAGLFTFYCAQHQPEMNGQILVLPASK